MDIIKNDIMLLQIIQKYGITLGVFTAIFTGMTSLVYMFTKPTIQMHILQQKQLLFDQIIPATMYDNNLQNNCFLVQTPLLGQGKHHIYIASKNNKLVGVIMEATTLEGYSGDIIRLMIGSNFSGTIFGVRVIEHHETPGLGDQIETNISNWILQFAGKVIHNSHDPSFAVKKDGGEFDQFTGATITPRAVINAVKYAGLYAQTIPKQISSSSSLNTVRDVG